jgi:uncharacterized membrane protein
MGITVNFGHPRSALALIGILLLPVVLTLAMHLLV